MNTNIRIRQLAKDFDRFPALFGIDLDIHAGELLALLGPSGSGKTTLLRAIAGLELPTRGQIFFNEDDASQTPVRERRVGFVFQHYALFKHMTVFDNIAFGLTVKPRAQRPSPQDIRARVFELLDLVQLPKLEERYPSQLSGGQRQRVALARALAVNPKVLLLDEPFGALDAKVRKDLRRWLRAIHDKTGYTTVFVTHDQEEALELADRVVVLNKGRIEQIGSPDSIYDSPKSPFVYDFIGDVTKMTVDVHDGMIHMGSGDARQSLVLTSLSDTITAQKALFYVRPQHWSMTVSTFGTGLNARVEGIRRHGPGRRVDLNVSDTLALEADLPADVLLTPNDRVSIRPLRWSLFVEDGTRFVSHPE
jgi:sulfate/thiosulfate transport system ATP-binding protein